MTTHDGAATSGGSDPRTHFEDMGHREMLQMLEGADHTKVTALADKLNDVAQSIDKIGSDLKTHMSNVEWSGEAGDAFRTWGGRVASATFKLSDYSQSAGTQMTHVANVLAEAQREMPPVPQDAVNTALTYRQTKQLDGPFADAAEGASPTVCMPDPSSAQYQQALTQMETDRTKAVDAMTKLGGAYQGATEVMSKQEQPSFPPPPQEVMPPRSGVALVGDTEPIPGGASRPVEETPRREFEPSGGHVTEGGSSTTTLGFSGGTPRAHTPEPPVGGGVSDQPGIPRRTPLPIEPVVALPGGGQGSTDIGSRLPAGVVGGRPSVNSLPGEGIQGGRLVEGPISSVGGGRLPQGTVIGGEEPPAAALSPGRYGAAASPAWERSTEDFTRGGSGLAGPRDPEAAGQGRPSMPMTGGAGFGGRVNRGRNGSRPDYLVEEEETWTPGDRKVVPSVLE